MQARVWLIISLLISCGSPSKSPSRSTEDPTSSTTTGSTESCAPSWFRDTDGDGFGDPAVGACDPGDGWVADATDCDDTRADVAPGATEFCDGIDNDCSGSVDEPYDDLDGDDIPDCEETLVFCESFDSLSGWAELGDGEWLLDQGVVSDARGGLYGAVLYSLENHGRHDTFRMEVRTAFTGSLNDLAGIVWDVDPDDATYLVMQWDDPQHDYQRHSPPGAMQLTECVDEVTCPVLARDATTALYWPADGAFVTWSVAVDHGQIQVLWDGQLVFDQYVAAAEERGPRQVGLYSNDNDGGVYYDDFCLWITPDIAVSR